MWLLASLLLWVPVDGQAEPTKAVITLQPPWVSMLQKETVNLWCEEPRLPGDNSTQWLHNNTAIQTLTPQYSITAASVGDSGEYRCQTGPSVPSDPVQLEILTGWLLLQVSSRVLTEGEPLILRCHGWKYMLVYNMLFYQNGKAFKFSPRDCELTILKTNLSHSGIYHCSGMGRHCYTSTGGSTSVKELFPAPVLRALLSSPLLEGNPVNLSCETKLLPQRPGLQLFFSFFMGSKTLKVRTTSSEYQILTAKREDSGVYWCEAATEDGNILKRSHELELQVLGFQSPIPIWFHVLFYLAWGIIFLVDTSLYMIVQKELQRKKKWCFGVSLTSGYGKKVTSYFQKDGHLKEEQKCQEKE